jgi:hypothetical protein
VRWAVSSFAISLSCSAVQGSEVDEELSEATKARASPARAERSRLLASDPDTAIAAKKPVAKASSACSQSDRQQEDDWDVRHQRGTVPRAANTLDQRPRGCVCVQLLSASVVLVVPWGVGSSVRHRHRMIAGGARAHRPELSRVKDRSRRGPLANTASLIPIARSCADSVAISAPVGKWLCFLCDLARSSA